VKKSITKLCGIFLSLCFAIIFLYGLGNTQESTPNYISAYDRLWNFCSLVDLRASHSLEYGEGLLKVKEGGFDMGRGALAYEKDGGGWKIYTDWNKSALFENKNINDIVTFFECWD
jgi:hypothetical protein